MSSKDDQEIGENVEAIKLDKCYGARHMQMLLLFFLIMFGYGMRVNLSVGIVAMTNNSTNPDFPTYDWDDKSIVLSSFFWGYVIPQIGAGQLAKTFGPKWFLVASMFTCSLFTILIPVMAPLGSWGVMICRFAQGVAQGFFFPSCHSLLSKWAPLSERSRFGSFVYSGGPFGTFITMPITGWICSSSLGWPFVFYLYGALGIGWVLIWIVFGYNSPSDHKTITENEKNYIQSSLGDNANKEPMPTPWKAIATSLPVWAILVTHCGQNWGFSTMLTQIPTYINSVLNFNINENGVLSACPYFIFWVMTFVFGAEIDYIINRGCVSVAVGRKIANSIGLYVPAIALLALGFTDEGSGSTKIVLTLLFIAVGINSACFAGFQVNHIDLSPNHAGPLMGITNGLSNIFAIIAPLAVQYIVTDETDASQWKMVFFIASAIYAFGNTFFVIYGSGEVQSWDSDSVPAAPTVTASFKTI